MASLLPAVHSGAPILAMSGGSMSLLPQAPPVHIAGMHGGASLLPLGPDVPMIAMRGGADLRNMVSNRTIVQKENEIKKKSAAKRAAATFGITTTFSGDYATLHGLSDVSNCNPIEENKTIKVCESLQPFVDRRVQALLKRTSFPPGDTSFEMGCGTIARKGTTLTVVFHHKGITLLSSDLTGTFATFHKGVPPYTPSPVGGVAGTHGLLSWMLGSPVTDAGVFDLITFMEQINGNHTLPLEGFRRFLSYHKEGVEEGDVLRYAMELYGYRTGDVTNTNDIYGLILPPHTAVRRTGPMFDIYVNGVVTQGTWDAAWTSQGGFAVYAPTS